MRTLTLFRGITVAEQDADAIASSVRENGLSGKEGEWKFVLRDLRPCLDAVFEQPATWRTASETVGEEFPMFCACGDIEGATYYACKHNRRPEKSRGLVIEIQAALDECFVDCRDFLCTVFQLWDAKSSTGFDEKRALLAEIFGNGVLRYFDKAATTKNQQERIALCNLAAHDLSVVEAHYSNRRCLRGRYGTTFHSAFAVRAPQGRDRIVAIRDADPAIIPSPMVLLESFR